MFIEIVRKRKRSWISKLPKYGWILLALLVLSAGVYLARVQYRRWNHANLVSKANGFMQNGDLRSAWLTTQQALQISPADSQSCRLMAQIADLSESSESIIWWSRVVQLEKNSLESIVPLVTAAMHFKEMGVAEEALGQIREADRNTAAYYQIMAAYCLTMGQIEASEKHFQKALQLQPKNERLQLDLASVRLQSSHAELVAQAHETLEHLRQNPKYHLEALRALSSDARRRGAFEEAHQIAGELIIDPACSFQDQLLFLDSLRESAHPSFAIRLKSLQRATEGKPDLTNQLIRWMDTRNMKTEALAWVKTMPAEDQKQILVQMGLAETLASLGRWNDLGTLITNSDWQGLDFIRFALLARCARESNLSADFQNKWERAVNATQGTVRTCYMLANMVDGWGWKTEAEQVWWLIAGHNSGQRAALKSLYRFYSDTKNTEQLYLVVERVFELEPHNTVAANNFASMSLLLKKNSAQADQIAAENYKKQPENIWFASTYAFSLCRQKKTGEALKVMEPFPEERLRQPDIALYQGLLLAANGDRDRARPFLDIALQSKDLLPEEKALAKKATHP